MADVRRAIFLAGLMGSLTGCNCNDETLAPAELNGLLVLDPQLLDFGSIDVGTSAELELAIQNDGRGELNITSAVGDGGPFVMRSTEGEVVPAEDRKLFKVTFSPTSSGLFENTIAIAHDGLNGPLATLRVRGTGKELPPPPPMRIAFEVDPPALDFGSLAAGDSRAMSFSVRNSGDLPLDISSIALEGNGEFRVRTVLSTPMQLSVGNSVSFEVIFAGSQIGQNIGRAIVTTNAPAPDASKTIHLRGEAYGPELEVNPRVLALGVVGINSIPTTKSVAVKNVGNRPLSVSSIIFNSSSPELLETARPTLPLVLQAGAEAELQVTYDPNDTLADDGSWTISSDDADESSLTVLISGTGGDPTGCSLAVLNGPLDFGYVMRGGRSTLAISLINVGLLPCRLNGAQPSQTGEFSINTERPGTPATIDPQAVHHVLVDFAPRSYGDILGSIVLDSDEGSFSVPMIGSSAESDILVLPSALDFGSVSTGCSSGERTIRIYNRGDNDEDFTAVYFAAGTPPEFEGETDDLGEEIDDEDDDYLEIFVRHRATTTTFAAGALVIEHTGPGSPIVIPLFANPSPTSNVTDSFRQAKPQKMDVLFVVDGSDDMNMEREELAARAASFMSVADTSMVDYQIAVTSMDVEDDGEEGRLYGLPSAIITPQTADRATRLASLFDGDLGDDDDQEGLEAAFLALTDKTLNEANIGFHRDGAMLSVIYMSSEDDESDWQFSMYRDALTSLKGIYRRGWTSANAFVGTEDDDCDTDFGDADYGEDYLDFAGAVGGRVESMCTSDYAAALTSLAEESFGGRRTFHLSSWPAAGNLEVKVDGIAVAPGTVTYLPGANAVRFEDRATPPEGALIELSYSSACY